MKRPVGPLALRGRRRLSRAPARRLHACLRHCPSHPAPATASHNTSAAPEDLLHNKPFGEEDATTSGAGGGSFESSPADGRSELGVQFWRRLLAGTFLEGRASRSLQDKPAAAAEARSRVTFALAAPSCARAVRCMRCVCPMMLCQSIGVCTTDMGHVGYVRVPPKAMQLHVCMRMCSLLGYTGRAMYQNLQQLSPAKRGYITNRYDTPGNIWRSTQLLPINVAPEPPGAASQATPIGTGALKAISAATSRAKGCGDRRNARSRKLRKCRSRLRTLRTSVRPRADCGRFTFPSEMAPRMATEMTLDAMTSQAGTCNPRQGARALRTPPP